MKSEPIWHPVASSTPPYVYLRQCFALSSEVQAARLQCACSGPFEVYLNGRMVGRGLGPAITRKPMWNTCDIRGLLQSGENILLVLARAHPDPEEPSWFRAEGEILCADEKSLPLCTGSCWRVLRADAWQVLDADPLSEVYFAESTAWREGRFREEEFEDATVVARPPEAPLSWAPPPVREEEAWAREVAACGEIDATGTLEFGGDPAPMTQCKCVHRTAVLQPGKAQALVQTRNLERAVYLVLDFGRVLTGFPCLRLSASPGSIIDMAFARTWGKLESGLRYVCGGGRQKWTGIQVQSCRYLVLRLSHCAEVLELDCVSMLERRAEVEECGRFAASEDLERIWETGRHTLNACRQEIYHVRSGAGSHDWLLAYALALGDYYLTGDCQTATATLVGVPPAADAEAPQALAYVVFLEAFQHFCGDCDLVTGLLPGAFQVLDACREHRAKDGLLTPVGEEWSATALNALYAGALDAASRLCRNAGEKERGALFDREFSCMRQALQAAWSEETGLFADSSSGAELPSSQWTNALVLYFGLADKDRQARIVQQIRGADVRRSKNLLQAFFLAGGLWRSGAAHRALKYVEQQWGRLAALEGRSWGEKAGLGEPAVLPGPEYYLGSQVLGIGPGAPGYQILNIRPQPAQLPRAQGRVWCRGGAVEVEWNQDVQNKRFRICVGLETSVETHVFAPRLGLRFPTVTLNGETVWRNEKIYANPFVQEVVSAEEYVVLVLRERGAYEVVVE